MPSLVPFIISIAIVLLAEAIDNFLGIKYNVIDYVAGMIVGLVFASSRGTIDE